MTKTNAMRLLDAAGIAYRTAEYEYDESDLSGKHAAEQLGMPAEQVFKTLVTRGDKTGLLVFCLSALPARAHVVDELAPLLDSDAIVNSIQDIGLLKKAGFIYQPDLTITGEMCPVDGSRDQLAVLSGMLAADRMYAFYFGDVSDAAKKNELLQQLVGKPLPTLNSKDLSLIHI